MKNLVEKKTRLKTFFFLLVENSTPYTIKDTKNK